jgi:hypothetical protein
MPMQMFVILPLFKGTPHRFHVVFSPTTTCSCLQTNRSESGVYSEVSTFGRRLSDYSNVAAMSWHGKENTLYLLCASRFVMIK